MKSANLLKTILLLCSAFLWLSCSSWEEVVAPNEFQPLKIISVSPDSAKAGDNIIITGENFLKEKDLNLVWLTPQVPATIDSATNTQLFLKVPDGALSGSVIVANAVYSDTSDNSFIVLKTAIDPASPAITDFSPKSGISGTVVTLTGQKFGLKKEEARVFFGSIQAEVIEATDSVLKVRAPFNSKDAQITINVKGKTCAAIGVFKTIPREHKIISVSPSSGYIGDEIKVVALIPKADTTGINFKIGKIPVRVKKVVGANQEYTEFDFILQIPETATSAPIYLSFYGEEVKSATSLQVLEMPDPVITSVSPSQGYPITTQITVLGKNFGPKVKLTLPGGFEYILASNNNQVYFSLPIGAETGKICIENANGRTGCSEQDFIVLKGEKQLAFSLSGVKILEETIRTSYSYSGGGSYYNIDTTKALKNVSEVISIKRGLKGQSGISCYTPLPDSILQAYTYNYPAKPDTSFYKTVEIDIDSVNKVFRHIEISQYNWGRYSSGSGFHDYSGEFCNKHAIKLTQVPYTKVNGKYSVQLKGNQVWQYITTFTTDNLDRYSRNGGSSQGGSTHVIVPRLHEVLPEASFELTLE